MRIICLEVEQMRYSELKKLLKEANCRLYKEGANHEQWYCPKTGKIFQVGRHSSQEVPNGTLNDVLKKAGLK